MLIVLSIVFFVFGLLFINGGIRIVRKKEFYWFSAGKYRWSKTDPVQIKGKKAVSQGIGYTVAGFLLIVVATYLFFQSL